MTVHHIGTKELITQRLVLRKIKMDDADTMFNEWCQDPDVARYTTWNVHDNVEETKILLEEWTDNYQNSDWYLWGITLRETGELIGTIDARERKNFTDDTIEIGYCLKKSAWNNGYATEALISVIDYLLNENGYNRVIAKHDTRNPASGRVMMKAGMKLIGTHQSACYSDKDRRFVDITEYEAISNEWSIPNDDDIDTDKR